VRFARSECGYGCREVAKGEYFGSVRWNACREISAIVS